MDRINTWILRYGDLLFEDELCKIKKDFPDKSDNYEFIFKHKNLFLKHIREKAEKKLKDNHCKFISK